MARLKLLATGFLFFWMAASPAGAVPDAPIVPVPVATRDPTPLQEPHAVDQPPVQKAVPAQRARSSSRHRAAAREMAKPRPRPAQATPSAVAKARPKPAPARAAQKPAPKLARVPRHGQSAPAGRRRFDYAEERPHSGPVYDSPPHAMAQSVPGGPACDQACQYRDWLDRYAAWYRDFGRYYYRTPHPPMRPAPPPMTYSENHAPPPPAYRLDQSERDRLDPWHGYDPRSPGNGY